MAEGEALGHRLKAFQAIAEGNGAWGPFGSIPVPTTEPCNSPGCPGQALDGMRISLLEGFAFERGHERMECSDLVGCKDAGGRKGPAGLTAGMDELQDHGCREQGSSS